MNSQETVYKDIYRPEYSDAFEQQQAIIGNNDEIKKGNLVFDEDLKCKNFRTLQPTALNGQTSKTTKHNYSKLRSETTSHRRNVPLKASHKEIESQMLKQRNGQPINTQQTTTSPTQKPAHNHRPKHYTQRRRTSVSSNCTENLLLEADLLLTSNKNTQDSDLVFTSNRNNRETDKISARYCMYFDSSFPNFKHKNFFFKLKIHILFFKASKVNFF